MANYKVLIKPSALKNLESIRLLRVRQRIDKAILDLSIDPFPTGMKKLTGESDYFRVRIGDFRAIYTVSVKEKIIIILKIDNRKDIYRQL